VVTKSKLVVVLLQSVITQHRVWWLRERTGDKLEKIFFDPQIGRTCLFKEVKKIKGVSKVGTPVQKSMGLV